MCAVECATQFTFPSFLFYLKKKSFRFWTTRTKKKKRHEKEQRECQRWLPLAPGLASEPLCLAQDACDLLVGIRIAEWSDVTIYWQFPDLEMSIVLLVIFTRSCPASLLGDEIKTSVWYSPSVDQLLCFSSSLFLFWFNPHFFPPFFMPSSLIFFEMWKELLELWHKL